MSPLQSSHRLLSPGGNRLIQQRGSDISARLIKQLLNEAQRNNGLPAAGRAGELCHNLWHFVRGSGTKAAPEALGALVRAAIVRVGRARSRGSRTACDGWGVRSSTPRLSAPYL